MDSFQINSQTTPKLATKYNLNIDKKNFLWEKVFLSQDSNITVIDTMYRNSLNFDKKGGRVKI